MLSWDIYNTWGIHKHLNKCTASVWLIYGQVNLLIHKYWGRMCIKEIHRFMVFEVLFVHSVCIKSYFSHFTFCFSFRTIFKFLSLWPMCLFVSYLQYYLGGILGFFRTSRTYRRGIFVGIGLCLRGPGNTRKCHNLPLASKTPGKLVVWFSLSLKTCKLRDWWYRSQPEYKGSRTRKAYVWG